MKTIKLLYLILLISYSGYSQDNTKKIDMSFKYEKYPYLIGQFKTLVLDGQNLISYANCPTVPTGASSNIGDHWFTSNLQNGYSSNIYGYREKLNNLYFNNNQSKYENSVFSYSEENQNLIFQELKFVNGKRNYNRQEFKKIFEINSNGIIDTYTINEFIPCSGLVLASATSTFTKNKDLFVGNIKTNQLMKIELPKYDNRFKEYKDFSTLSGAFKGYLAGEEVITKWYPYEVFQHNDIITAFVQIKLKSWATILKAVQINTTTGKIKMLDTDINLGGKNTEFKNDYKHRFYAKGREIFYLPESGGFVSFYPTSNSNYDQGSNSISGNYTTINFNSNVNYNYKVTLFDKNVAKIKDINLNNFTYISYANEIGNYIILGGYTKTKGYVGYANPQIVVLNKNNLSIAYEKTIPEKNSTVDIIKKYDNNVIIAIAGVFDLDNPIKPYFLIQSLDYQGKLTNQLKPINNTSAQNYKMDEKKIQTSSNVNLKENQKEKSEETYQEVKVFGNKNKEITVFNRIGNIISKSEYYPNGSLYYKINYKDGEKDGEVKRFNINGELIYIENYLKGQLDGELIWFHPDENGKLYKFCIRQFKNGNKISETYFNPDGSKK